MTDTPDTLTAWLDSRRGLVDEALERLIPSTSRAPTAIVEAMRYSLFAGGKRLRPMLVLASAEAVAERAGLQLEAATELALPAACAVELIHTYSLVHDDLPAMDDDTMRRGRPTAHVVFGEGMAILAGDALLTEAFALMARAYADPREFTPSREERAPAVDDGGVAIRSLRALHVIADAAGAEGMVGGQAIDLQAAVPGAPPLGADALRAMHARKTGALIRGSAAAGAIMVGATPDLLTAVDAYAAQLGLAFQIVDDILDVEGASADLGKTAGKDAAAGKPTYPALFGLEESRRLAARCIGEALAALEAAGLRGQLPAIARWVVGRSQ